MLWKPSFVSWNIVQYCATTPINRHQNTDTQFSCSISCRPSDTGLQSFEPYTDETLTMLHNAIGCLENCYYQPTCYRTDIFVICMHFRFNFGSNKDIQLINMRIDLFDFWSMKLVKLMHRQRKAPSANLKLCYGTVGSCLCVGSCV